MGPVNRRSTPLVLIAFRIRMRGISLGRGCRACLHADNGLRGEDTRHLVTRRSPLGRWCLECDDASGQHLPLDSTPGGETRQTSGGRWTTGTRDSGKATCDNCHEQNLQSSGRWGNDVDNDRSISQCQSGAALDFMLCYGDISAFPWQMARAPHSLPSSP